jgi:hypothetical protein
MERLGITGHRAHLFQRAATLEEVRGMLDAVLANGAAAGVGAAPRERQPAPL